MTYSRARAITTRYQGFALRSRLEARWAVFLDHLGIKWDYEPEGFELGNGMRYLPDFWLPDWDMWLEIKPDAPDDVSIEKATRLLNHTGKPVYISSGMPDRNGVFLFHDDGHIVSSMPAFAYFTAERPLVLCFGAGHGFPEHRCRKIDVHEMPYAEDRARDGARLQGRLRDAVHAARAARFEFGQEGA